MKKSVNVFRNYHVNESLKRIDELNNTIDYKHCMLNVISSILTYYGYKSDEYNYETLSVLDKYLQKNYKNVVFMIFDGLGDKILNYHSEFGILNMCKEDVIDSSFPPTTVSCITSIETGVDPKTHASLGWSMYFSEIDKVMDVFLTRNSKTKNAIVFNEKNPNPFLKLKKETVFSKIKTSTFAEVERYELYPKKIARDSKDNKCIQVENICDIFSNVTDIINSSNNEKFIYAYFDKPDSIMHSYGTQSVLVKNVIDQIEENLEKTIKDTCDTLFIISSDHGLIDNKNHIIINDENIYKYLKRRPDIEGRAMNFYVKEEFMIDFEKEFRSKYSDIYRLYSKVEVLSSNLFGLSDSKDYERFIGDYLAIAISDTTFAIKDDCELRLNKASHAGRTIDEIKIPLVIIENNR